LYLRLELRLEAEDMFYHAYNAYMSRAWPADELMPLSCRGRYRGREPSRGDIDEALGNFSLTLIDSLDMLVVLGDLDEFEAGVQKVVTTVTFDTDVVVSVFETNIRIVGGLVSAHILAELGRIIFGLGERKICNVAALQYRNPCAGILGTGGYCTHFSRVILVAVPSNEVICYELSQKKWIETILIVYVA
jgi:hypothetical protein